MVNSWQVKELAFDSGFYWPDPNQFVDKVRLLEPKLTRNDACGVMPQTPFGLSSCLIGLLEPCIQIDQELRQLFLNKFSISVFNSS